MAKKPTAEETEAALAQALATIETLKAEIATLKAPKADEPLSADELDIRRRVRAGLSRKDAEEAHARQKAHDAEQAALAATTGN